MTTKLKPCTSANGRHSWEWKRDRTNQAMNIGHSGTTVRLSRVGLYRCKCCPEWKEGRARSGL